MLLKQNGTGGSIDVIVFRGFVSNKFSDGFFVESEEGVFLIFHFLVVLKIS